MSNLRYWGMGLLFIMMSIPATAKVQCHCQTIPADGEGNTSCSTSESGGRCTIDFNLFGRESEERAAQLLSKFAKTPLKAPNADLSADQALRALSVADRQQLLDAILIYVTVAAGDQYARPGLRDSVPIDSLKELVDAVRSGTLATPIIEAFGQDAMKKWSALSDEELRDKPIPVKKTDNVTISPGCVEFTTTRKLWMMFKTSWSPARIASRCDPAEQK